MRRIPESELILNPDGSVYHLNLLPEDIAPIIFTVGDPARVARISRCFDKIEVKKEKREFITHTGELGSQRLSVISTGIGTDNIDIVFTEIDALVNIDFSTRTIKEEKQSLSFIRIGTSGCLQPGIPVNSILLSEYGLGMDGLLNYYSFSHSDKEQHLLDAITDQVPVFDAIGITPVLTKGSESLFAMLSSPATFDGITASCTGFYGPQGRILRLLPVVDDLPEKLRHFASGRHRITNFEMETAAMYGMANMLGHQALSVNALIANRAEATFSKNPKKTVDNAIHYVLEKITESH